MRYGPEQYSEDWNLSIALAQFIADGKTHFEPMLESCMNRIIAYQSNNPEALPFERYSL
jgi:hypothetical protein